MLIVFDWDGTLIDSATKIVGCMQQAGRDAGVVACTDAEVRNIIGLGLDEALHRLYPDELQAVRDEVRRCYSERFVVADQTPCDFFPGVRQVLDGFREAGLSLAVATGKSRRGLNRVLGNLGMESYFNATRCADETASKPDPLMLRELCEEFSLRPEEAVLVGDTEYDLEMAQRIAMPSVGVSYGAHAPERLLRWSPLAILDQFSGLPGLLERQYQGALN